MNPSIDQRIIDFIREHHVLTLATVRNNVPYCSNCFYVYVGQWNAFVFTSEKKTKHIQDTHHQNQVAGSVVLETSVVGKIQGIQFNGTIREALGEEYKTARRAYLKRFPFAILKQTDLWIVELTFVKMTDNRLGFGKKLIWES